MSTELQIRPDQSAFDDKQLAALRALGVQNAPAADVALLFHQAARTGLDPFARQIYLIGRGGKYTIQTGIDGFRVIRDRKGTYQGQTEEWCGTDGVWTDVWLKSEHPAAARVRLYINGFQVPVPGIARWSEYAQESSPTWKKMPALMLAKCAEALALRKAYPQDLSGLYTTDEIPEAEQNEDGVHVVTTMRDTAPPKPARDARSWWSLIQEQSDVEGLATVWEQIRAAHALNLQFEGRALGDIMRELKERLVESEIAEQERQEADQAHAAVEAIELEDVPF